MIHRSLYMQYFNCYKQSVSSYTNIYLLLLNILWISLSQPKLAWVFGGPDRRSHDCKCLPLSALVFRSSLEQSGSGMVFLLQWCMRHLSTFSKLVSCLISVILLAFCSYMIHRSLNMKYFNCYKQSVSNYTNICLLLLNILWISLSQPKLAWVFGGPDRRSHDCKCLPLSASVFVLL